MAVMGLKKNLDGVGGWGELYPSFFWDFWKNVNFAKAPKAVGKHSAKVFTVICTYPVHTC